MAEPSTETYIVELCNTLQSVCIGSPVRLPRPKRRLSEILDFEDETESDTETTNQIIKLRKDVQIELDFESVL